MTRPSDTSMDSNRFQRGYTTCVALAVISPSEIWKQNKGDNSKSVTLPEKDAITKFKPFKPFNLSEMIRKKKYGLKILEKLVQSQNFNLS